MESESKPIFDISGFKNIVILSGAGVSTGAGIPDYRSPNGIFNQMGLSNPEEFFSRSNPQVKEALKQFHSIISKAEPTPSHKFAKWLNDHGVLRRVYTQNIDGLYQKTGLPKKKIVEFHGNSNDDTVVLYGDSIDPGIIDIIKADFIENTEVDLIIVMGTSLQVAPFCAIPNLVTKQCTRVLVDKNPDNAVTNPWTKRQRVNSWVYEPGRNGDMPQCSYIKFGKRKVTLRPQWDNHRKYSQPQHIIQADTDIWVTEVMNNFQLTISEQLYFQYED